MARETDLHGMRPVARHSDEPLLLRILAERLDEPGSGREHLVKPEDVHFVFLGRSVGLRRIHAHWARETRFRPERIYLATRRGVYRTGFRTLESLRDRLPAQVVRGNHGLLVNLDRATSCELIRVKTKRMCFPPAVADGSVGDDGVVLSQLCARNIRRWFGLGRVQPTPKRVRRRKACGRARVPRRFAPSDQSGERKRVGAGQARRSEPPESSRSARHGPQRSHRRKHATGAEETR